MNCPPSCRSVICSDKGIPSAHNSGLMSIWNYRSLIFSIWLRTPVFESLVAFWALGSSIMCTPLIWRITFPPSTGFEQTQITPPHVFSSTSYTRNECVVDVLIRYSYGLVHFEIEGVLGKLHLDGSIRRCRDPWYESSIFCYSSSCEVSLLTRSRIQSQATLFISSFIVQVNSFPTNPTSIGMRDP